MVGVPGLSKGCHTCKKRRIKCDESKPICQRCQKSGYLCTGYGHPLHFVHASTAPFPSMEDVVTTPKRLQESTSTMPATVVPRMRTPAPNELSFVAFKGDFCVSFLFDNFVWRTYGTPWLQMAAAGKLNPLALEACQALSWTHFGVTHHQRDILVEGSVRYGKTLKGLIPGLSDPMRPGVEALIVPVMIMLMHASFQEDRAASIAHLKGLATLLHVCGPKKFQREPLRSAFESCRATLVTTALIARQRTFLEQEGWCSIPWALDAASKSQQNHLVDILVTVPGFLEDDAKLRHIEDPEVKQSLLDRVRTQLANLYSWRWAWDAANTGAVWEVCPSPSPAIAPRAVDKTLHFSSHVLASEISLYNAVLMWLLGLLWRLDPFASFPLSPVSETRPRGPILLPHQVHSLRDPAIEICLTFEFQMRDASHSRDSALFFLFPLGQAWTALESEAAFRDWIRSMLDKSTVTRGYAIGRNAWFGNYYIPKVFQ
ncbi:uncharacterized protein BDZ99DRAFT_143497 [Mytilinidion resinicola]|uniref:Zn(2)-C6 fungal-type domain-containing protein n=1 Tax=Mytilinidion resinicola TaxID=574789 RepID=A0A6A6Y7Z9_9PEZI|nr:uncharacterized protein BDZ99DRAFT_143497 [Mytilinidion resinicola]KAF2804810.1 hypothetical protein BDZ99DRAFT_143497 [Mytilinidion resinicola]